MELVEYRHGQKKFCDSVEEAYVSVQNHPKVIGNPLTVTKNDKIIVAREYGLWKGMLWYEEMTTEWCRSQIGSHWGVHRELGYLDKDILWPRWDRLEGFRTLPPYQNLSFIKGVISIDDAAEISLIEKIKRKKIVGAFIKPISLEDDEFFASMEFVGSGLYVLDEDIDQFSEVMIWTRSGEY